MVEIGYFFALDWFYFIDLCSILLLRLSHFCPSILSMRCLCMLARVNRSFKSEIESECKANKVHAILLMSRSRIKGY